jgi:hypothetical protein
MKHTVISVVIALLVTVSIQASELSLVAGGAALEDLTVEDSVTSFKHPTLFGARYEKDFLILLGFENNLIISRNMLSPKGSPGEQAIYYTGNFVVNFPVDRIVPNIAIGLGALYRFGNERPDVGASFLTNWGFGVKFRDLIGPLGARIDYRRIGIRGVEHQTITEQEITGGLLFSF